jgi:hypothetical protein
VKGLPLDELHGDEQPSGMIADLEDRDHVGMDDLREGPGLAKKSGAPLLGVEGLCAQHLDRHRAIEIEVAGGIDLAHAPHADPPGDLEMTQILAGLERWLGSPSAVFGVSPARNVSVIL